MTNKDVEAFEYLCKFSHDKQVDCEIRIFSKDLASQDDQVTYSCSIGRGYPIGYGYSNNLANAIYHALTQKLVKESL